MISIAAATDKDIPRLLEIERDAISPPWTHGALLSELYRGDSFFAVAVGECGMRNAECGITRESAASAANAELKTSEFVIDNEGTYDGNSSQLLGFVILRRMGDEGELLQIAVDSAARRRGVADALLEAALGFSLEHALKSVFLEVRLGNEAAIALYTKHCFQTVRRRKDYYTNPAEDAVVMVKEF